MKVEDKVRVHTTDEFNGLVGVISRMNNGFVWVRFTEYGLIEFPFSEVDVEVVE